jgi:hypothetical protein
MITPTEITTHLQTYLPIFTDKFTEFMTVISASMGASNVVTVNVTAHGKSPGDSVVVTAGTTRNELTAAILSGSSVIFTTAAQHDLIKPSQPLDVTEITLAGFTGGGTAWNGTHTILDVPDRTSFTLALPGAEVAPPSLDGGQYLMEQRPAGLNGLQVIATVPTADSFTIDYSSVPDMPDGVIDNMSIIKKFRIYAVADFKRAQAVYTEQSAGKLSLFLIMGDGDVSKDRHTLNDGTAGLTVQDLGLLRILRDFSTVVFIPTGADLSGSDAQDLAYNEIMIALLKTMFGFTDFAGGSAIQYIAVPTGDGPTEYNTAYYGHAYGWQLPHTITYEDGFLVQQSVAFRDIAQTLKLFADDQAEMTANINLDEGE